MSIRYTALSEIGLKMNENQDGLFCAADGESGIFLVADGMGGHQDGAWASAAIVKKTSVWWDGYRASLSRPGFFGGVEELKKIFSEVNQEIYSGTKKGELCGSTLVALWVDHGAWAVFSCGDSRCYQGKGRWLKREFCQLTSDDVWENQQQMIAGLSEDEIKRNKNYGRLVRAVGVQPKFQCSVQSESCKEETLFMLCSDGIYKYCPEEYLRKQAMEALQGRDLDQAAANIREQVLNNGAGDNLSLMLVLTGDDTGEARRGSNRRIKRKVWSWYE